MGTSITAMVQSALFSLVFGDHFGIIHFVDMVAGQTPGRIPGRSVR